MRRLRQWLIRLTTSATRRRDDTRLREEIDDHIAFETDANLRRGLPPAEARRRALLAFGSIGTFEETWRDLTVDAVDVDAVFAAEGVDEDARQSRARKRADHGCEIEHFQPRGIAVDDANRDCVAVVIAGDLEGAGDDSGGDGGFGVRCG